MVILTWWKEGIFSRNEGVGLTSFFRNPLYLTIS
jgi:hypothetical protein